MQNEINPDDVVFGEYRIVEFGPRDYRLVQTLEYNGVIVDWCAIDMEWVTPSDGRFELCQMGEAAALPVLQKHEFPWRYR